jgi:phage gpG-like protein
MPGGMEVQGAEELAAAFGAAARSRDLFHAAQRTDAETIANRARQRAPRRTGRLRSSIKASTDADAAVVTVGVAYGRHQEFGWRTGFRTIPGRHFVLGAIDDTTPQRIDAYVTTAQNLMDQIGSVT